MLSLQNCQHARLSRQDGWHGRLRVQTARIQRIANSVTSVSMLLHVYINFCCYINKHWCKLIRAIALSSQCCYTNKNSVNVPRDFTAEIQTAWRQPSCWPLIGVYLFGIGPILLPLLVTNNSWRYGGSTRHSLNNERYFAHRNYLLSSQSIYDVSVLLSRGMRM